MTARLESAELILSSCGCCCCCCCCCCRDGRVSCIPMIMANCSSRAMDMDTWSMPVPPLGFWFLPAIGEKKNDAGCGEKEKLGMGFYLTFSRED